MTQRARQTLLPLLLAIGGGACTERMTAPGVCPNFCPGDSLQIEDLVLTNALGRDSAFAGYLQAYEAEALPVANLPGIVDSRAVFLMGKMFPQVVSGSDTAPITVDSSWVRVNVVRRDTKTANLWVKLYGLPIDLDSTKTFAQLTPAFSAAPLDSANIDSLLARPLLDDTATVRIWGDSIHSDSAGHVLLQVGADSTLALYFVLDTLRAPFVSGDSGQLAFGVRVAADSLASIALGAQEVFGRQASLRRFYHYTKMIDSTTDSTVYAAETRQTTFDSFVFDPPNPALDSAAVYSTLVVGGAPAVRTLVRVTVPPFLSRRRLVPRGRHPRGDRPRSQVALECEHQPVGRRDRAHRVRRHGAHGADRPGAGVGARHFGGDGPGIGPGAGGGDLHANPFLLLAGPGLPPDPACHVRPALPVRGSMTRARVGLVLLLAGAAPGAARAQDSQFGIRGLGTPGRWETVRARSTGGAFAPFDPFSALMEASLADVRRLAAGVTTGTSWRSVDVGGTDASLRASRFPALVIAGPITRRISFAGGFATYLDKSFGILTRDTIDLRGQPEGITDEISSDGAVADLRLAGAARLGGSASLLLDLTPDLRVAGWLRSDTKLTADLHGRTTATTSLPLAFGGGVRWRAGARAALAGAVAWRFWGESGPNAHDTFTWSAGGEVGSLESPLRVGVRGGQLPFGPGAKAPTEFGVAAGLGKQFSGGRGRLDFGLERLERRGDGLTERVWTFLLGLTVRP